MEREGKLGPPRFFDKFTPMSVESFGHKTCNKYT